jgi:hypothetical protein
MGLILMLSRYVLAVLELWALANFVQTVIKDLRKEGAAQKRVSNAPAAE